MLFRLPLTLILSAVLVSAHADNWQPLTGTDLRALVNDTVIEGGLAGKAKLIGQYCADGSGRIKAWGEHFPRSWEIQGDQLCIQATDRSDCFTIEKNADEANQYRVVDSDTGEVWLFSVLDREADFCQQQAAAPSQTTPPATGGNVGPTAEEMANKLANPTTAVSSLGNSLDYTKYKGNLPGASDQSGWSYLFQAGFPFPQESGANILFRPAIPVLFNRPVPTTTGFEDVGVELGDIGFDLAYGKTFDSGLIALGGVVATMPTATDKRAGGDQWLLGPEAVLGVAKKWGVVGALLSHSVDVGGSNKTDTKITGGSYFYAFSLGGGLQLASAPNFSYNHNAPSGDEWTFPLGVGLAKTQIIKGRPWKMQVQYWNYIESPDAFGPKHLLRFTISPVVSLPWTNKE